MRLAVWAGGVRLAVWAGGLAEKLYESGRSLHRKLTRVRHLPHPVLSVGNIASGGRGKTPVVIHLARELKRRGADPVVLSRGYGRDESGGSVWILEGQLPSVAQAGDEPLEIFFQTDKTPVLVGAKRYENALKFERQFPADAKRPRVYLLDDGFQHWGLARAVDLVLLHTDDFQDRLLPVGRLREKASEALPRATFVWELGKDFFKWSRWVSSESPAPSTPLHYLTTRARAEAVPEDLRQRFPQLQPLSLADHAGVEEIEQALRRLPPEVELLVGAKEAVKLVPETQLEEFFVRGSGRSRHGRRLWLLRCELGFAEPRLMEMVLEKILATEPR